MIYDAYGRGVKLQMGFVRSVVPAPAPGTCDAVSSKTVELEEEAEEEEICIREEE